MIKSAQTKQVIFALGDEEYGLDIMIVNAIEKYTDIVRVPNGPECIKGIINLRGDVIPVYSLRKKFGLEEKGIDENTKLVITKSNNIMMAYEVDAVKEIIEIPDENISETPIIVKGKNTSYIKSIANINGRMIILLDHNGILTEKEQENIELLMENQ
ncbi:chemotaxis protein CheW [Anaerocolumna aminovalerica]|jgi:purine-binding chemotaxis protein CheW|uniref:Purine-binding chemotaxis protein CheW n=1 Tax=Anaerocolumna aminovalerica TaxID=1527 RepID=A0A1I5HJA0_9FIRM|nr:chemotaxis protein CheW [Anaerocolumna aminovalerica]MBU5333642.1 chemotaxis protein CheW [Anaerocolumna aminovalerica]MDU6265930.1 chemotaxis protein CheW [Anaerocolumna aminovalerica]SFO48313.1 purine-binding chemotaxis protein CheW [Anaerocolumna aminovalerica]